MPGFWDYLVVTASNAMQAQAYEAQLRLRQELDLLPRVRQVLVVPDLDGKRIGSGGSTVFSIAEVLRRERHTGAAEEILRGLRILIVHDVGWRCPVSGCGVGAKSTWMRGRRIREALPNLSSPSASVLSAK